MKNFLKTSVYLFSFAIAGILFQISCSNSDNTSQPSTTNSTPIGKIVFAKRVSSDWQIWTCNYNGTGLTQIPITLPPNVVFNFTNLQTNIRLSPDGQKAFFVVADNNTNNLSIYSCDINGSNLQQVTALTSASNVELGGAY